MIMDYLSENRPKSFADFIQYLMEWELPPKEIFERILQKILNQTVVR